MPVYSKHLRNIIIKGIEHPQHRETPLQGMRIVLDAGNGGGGFLATDVLAPLGANIEGELLTNKTRPCHVFQDGASQCAPDTASSVCHSGGGFCATDVLAPLGANIEGGPFLHQ